MDTKDMYRSGRYNFLYSWMLKHTGFSEVIVFLYLGAPVWRPEDTHEVGFFFHHVAVWLSALLVSHLVSPTGFVCFVLKLWLRTCSLCLGFLDCSCMWNTTTIRALGWARLHYTESSLSTTGLSHYSLALSPQVHSTQYLLQSQSATYLTSSETQNTFNNIVSLALYRNNISAPSLKSRGPPC